MPRRFFIGVDLSDDIRHGLAAHLNEHVDEMPGRASPPQNWHMTLRFIGLLDDERLDLLRFRLAEVDWGKPFTVGFDGLDAFPHPRRATVLWLRIGVGYDQMTQLARTAEQAVRTIGLEPEGRPFVPHLTLSRVRPPVDVKRLVAAFPPFHVRQQVSVVHLFESVAGSYPIEDSFDLR